MKILHISKYYYPFIGGIEQTAAYLAEGLKRYENRVVCFNTKKGYQEDEVNGVKVYRMSNDLFIARQSLSLGYYTHLKRIMKEYCPDAIHLHCPNPFVYPLILSIIPKSCKLLLHWHLDIVSQKMIYPIIKSFETKLLKRADLICVTSPNYRDNSKPLTPYINKVEILQSAIDTHKFLPQIGDEKIMTVLKNKAENKPIVFFVGRHVEYKGIKYLLEASRYVKSDCRILIAGNGPMTKQLKAMEYNTSKVIFIGRISDDELRCYLKISHIFAFPSITKNEAFGLSLAEAMYIGCVPVTFRIEGSGVNWVSINNETGIEVSNSDSKQFAMAIDELIENDVLRRKYSMAAHARIANMFTIDKEIEKADTIYRKLMFSSF